MLNSKWVRVSVASVLLFVATTIGLSRADNLNGLAGLFGALIQQAQQDKTRYQNDFVYGQRLQIALRRLGLYHGKIDGHIGAGTTAALLEFYNRGDIEPPSAITTATVTEVEAAARQSTAKQISQNIDSSSASGNNGEGPSFSCEGNLTLTEQTICNSGDLSDLDQQMYAAYQQAIGGYSSNEQQDKIRSRAKQFSQQRDACNSSSDCIKRSYAFAISDIGRDRPTSGETSHKLIEVSDIDPKLNLGAGRAWIIVASRENLSDALLLSDDYADRFDSVLVMRSPKGAYAIAIGWAPKDLGRSLLQDFKARNLIPQDSFLSDGLDYSAPVFAKARPNPKTRDLLFLVSMLRPSSHGLAEMQNGTNSLAFLNDYSVRIGGLDSSDDYIGVRSQPEASKKPQYLLPHGTLLRRVLDSGDWTKVQTVSGISGWVQKPYLKTLAYTDDHDSSKALGVTPQVAEISSTPIQELDQTQKDDIRAHATILLSDIDGYLKTDPKIDELTSLAELVGQVQKFQTLKDYISLQASVQKLEERAAPLPGYKSFVQKSEEARKETDARALETADGEAKRNVFFMEFYIKNNVTAEVTPQMATVLKRYNNALNSPSLAELTSLNSVTATLISKYDLNGQYSEKLAKFAPSSDAARARTLVEVLDQYAKGPAKPLMTGNGGDFVFLYNDTKLAPSIIKNLKGDFEFAGSKAKVCAFHMLSDSDIKRGLLSYLAGKGAPNIDLDHEPCNETQFLKYDLLIGQRKQILALTQSYMLPVLQLMADGQLKEFSTPTEQDISRSAQYTKETLIALESDILAGAKNGYGLVRIENASAKICANIVGDAEPHLRALKEQSRAVVEAVGESFGWSLSGADQTFVLAKKGECGAAYNDAKSLAVLIQGLKRDGIAYHMAPLWIENATIISLQGVIESERQDKIKQQADKQKNIDDESKLAAAKQVDYAAQRVTIEKKLRDENGPRARTKTDAIRDGLREFADGKESWTTAAFQGFSSWYTSQLQNHWELVSIESSVRDFGSAKWKDRKLEAAFTETHVTMKNKILGETKDYCWILGGIDDAEYQMERETFATQCDQADGTLSNWFVANGFISEWVAPANASN